MESFIFRELNKASRRKDVDKIKFYGPFASALSFIIHCGNKSQSELPEQLTVYRGFQITNKELDDKYFPGNSITL